MTQEQRQAVAEIYRRYYAAMVRRAMAYVDVPEEAEDVVSSCWLALMKHLPTLLGMDEKARSAYLLRSVQNRAIDCLKRRQRQRGYMDGLKEELQCSAGDSWADPAATAEVRDGLRVLLLPLTERQRQVVLLRLAGWTPREIAELLEQSVESVRSTWRRAVTQMRRTLRRG